MTHTEQTISTVQAASAAYHRANLAVCAHPGADEVFALIGATNRLLDACVRAGMSPQEDEPERWAEQFL